MPPRHGQSQLISPVSSLKAPSWDASSSVSSNPGSAVTGVDSGAGTGGVSLRLREEATDSRVGRAFSCSLGSIEGTGVGLVDTAKKSEIHTCRLLGEEGAGVVVVDCPYCHSPSCCAALPATGFLGRWRGGDEAAGWGGAEGG